MKKKNKKIVVLLSGGLDSTTLAYLASKEFSPHIKNRVFLLTFDYGQKHKKELTSAIKVSKKIGAIKHQIVKIDLSFCRGSSLTNNSIKIPQNRELFKTHGARLIPNTYVPARNAVFLSFAMSYAEAIGAEEIYIGVNSIDYSGYVDCRKVFIDKFQEMAKHATVTGVYGKAVKIKTPLINMTKSQIVKLGEKLQVDWKGTWSCYSGRKEACGVCDSCQLRLKGFMLAGIKDPIKYNKLPEFYKRWLMSKQQEV